MRLKIIKTILLLSFVDFISCKGYFSIVAPKNVRHDTQYHVAVSSYGFEVPQILEVAIRNSNKEEESYEIVKNVTLINGKTQTLAFDLKGQPERDYSLEVQSLSGDEYKQVITLMMNTKKFSTFVQTDKSIYKPADKVQFRVLVLDAETKPFKSSKVQIHVTDGAQNRIKQFDNIIFKKGVFENEFQLSDSPVMGKWKIHVKVDEKETIKEFEVAEYTLPKFEVALDVGSNANFKDGKIRATVRAKYTFGKIAKGNATITAETEEYYWRRNEVKKVVKTVDVDGVKFVEFDIADELGLKEKDRERKVKLFATFKEELTGREENATATATIHLFPYKVELEKSSDVIRPGLPYSATVFVKNHDKNAPVIDKHNKLKVTIKYFYDTMRYCQRRPYTRYYKHSGADSAEDDGRMETYRCREEHSYDEVRESFLTNGIYDLDLEIPSNTTRIELTAKYLEAEASQNYIPRPRVKTSSYIQIKSLTEHPKITKNVKIDVKATENLSHITYQVFAKGALVVSETVEVPNTKNFKFDITPTAEMLPTAKVVVHYISIYGEIISHQTDIEFGNEFVNYVDVELSKNQAKPGEKIEISVSAKPNSFVALLGVDQSVLLLKSGNDIEKSTVLDEMEVYNGVDKWNYHWKQNVDYRQYKDFNSAVFLTNAEKEMDREYISLYVPEVPTTTGAPGAHHPRPHLEYHLQSRPMPVSSYESVDSDVSYAAMPPPRGDSGGPLVGMAGPGAPPPKVIEIRKTFPETWIFDSFDFDSSTSNVTVSKKVPDTITSWIITGFSVDPETGLGLTRQSTKFNVFQPFFVTTNLPYSIKRGEVVSIPILVFNYLDSDQDAEVTLFNEDHEFEFTQVKEGARRKRAMEVQQKKKILVKSQSGVSVPFMIRPLKVGHIKIKVTASSAVAGDGLERKLIVEPEGVTQYKNEAIFIDLRNEEKSFKSHFNITIPSNAVPDSTKIEALAMGDILGSTIDNLESLIKLPYGCGEQNMLNFVPNIVVLDYLTTLKKLTPEIEAKAIKFMETGYQRELTYKHNDGSYSAFGGSDSSGSTWLTAFVAKSFHQASKYISVDQEIIKAALDFLAKAQTTNGSFPEIGHVSHKAMQGGSSKGIALTAYTLITFLENKNLAESYKSTIDKALEFIASNYHNIDDNYSLAIATYAMQLAGHGSRTLMLTDLMAKADKKDGTIHWAKEIPKSDESNPWAYQPNSVNVEMSAYALHALLIAGSDADAVLVMKWLVNQRNENGGFQSTQDTVVGLQALSKLAAKIYVPQSSIEILLSHGGENQVKLIVKSEDDLILRKYEIPSNARNFEVAATGHGFGILQLAYRYNLNTKGDWPRFLLSPKLHQNSNKEFLHLTVCTSFVPDDSADKSNMAVMEVSFPSGYTFDADSMIELKATEKVKKVETKDSETIVIVYFDDISSKNLCPEFKAYQTSSVAKLKPAPVKVYDYYDNSRRATSFYDAPAISLCDICDGAENCKKDCEEMEINLV